MKLIFFTLYINNIILPSALQKTWSCLITPVALCEHIYYGFLNLHSKSIFLSLLRS